METAQAPQDVHIVEVDSASREPAPHSFLRQVDALMRKSALNQKRQSRTNACQLLFPLTMMYDIMGMETGMVMEMELEMAMGVEMGSFDGDGIGLGSDGSQ